MSRAHEIMVTIIGMEGGTMLNMNPAIGWLVLIIILLVIEIATLGLTTIWFAGGATAAFLSTFFGAGPVIQWMLFLVLSLAFLLLTRPMAVRYMKNNQVSTNADSLVGKTVVVSEKIDNLAQSGKVNIADIEWMARSTDDLKIIPAGRKVKICSRRETDRGRDKGGKLNAHRTGYFDTYYSDDLCILCEDRTADYGAGYRAAWCLQWHLESGNPL